MPTYAGYENTWCGGGASVRPPGELVGYDSLNLPILEFLLDEQTLSFSSSLCTLQGAIIQFGFLSAVCWWVIIAFNMCLEVRRITLHINQFLSCFGDNTLSAWTSRYGNGADLEFTNFMDGESLSF